MTENDKEFIIRVLAAHAVTSGRYSSGTDITDTVKLFRQLVDDFSFASSVTSSPEPKTVRTQDGREFVVRDRSAS